MNSALITRFIERIDQHINNADKLIIALSWRDIKSPKAGGAEIHTHELLKAVNKDKYAVIHIAFSSEGLSNAELIDQILYIRHGSYLSYILFARRIYRHYLKQVTAVLDQCNTWRAFSPFWVKAQHRVFYIHQLTREIWHIQSKGLFAWIGEHTETAMLKLNRHDRVITVSKSTADDLVQAGFDRDRMLIVRNGLPQEIISFKGSDSVHINKEQEPVFIYVGRYARYKGINDTIEAFGLFKKDHPDAKLWIVGKPDEKYLSEDLLPLCDKHELSTGRISDHESDKDITIWGFVPEEKKYELMERAHALICPSVREGWGIIISEAGFLGTPGIVYDSPGLRDAVDMGQTGYMCSENTPGEIARLMRRSVDDAAEYDEIRNRAITFASSLRWDANTEIINRFFDDMV